MTQAETVDAAARQRRNRIQLVTIMMIGFLTLGGSYLLFYVAKSEGGWGTTNNGVFVTPPTTTADLGWQVQGDTRRWWLWIVADECSNSCQQTVKNMQALHILLNREADRVRRGYTGSQEEWMAQFPELAVVSVDDAGTLENGVYIVDPNGNLVFFYPLNTEPKPVLTDLKKLLKVSHIG